MKMPSEAEVMQIFEALGLKNEEDRLKIIGENKNTWAVNSEHLDNDYYSIRLSANTRID